MHKHLHPKSAREQFWKVSQFCITKYIVFNFYSNDEQKCNTVLCGNVTSNVKCSFLLHYLEITRDTNKDV